MSLFLKFSDLVAENIVILSLQHEIVAISVTWNNYQLVYVTTPGKETTVKYYVITIWSFLQMNIVFPFFIHIGDNKSRYY